MKLHCPRCRCFLGNLGSELSGHPARCESCGENFIIPFTDSGRLLEWAAKTPWDHLEEGNRHGIGRGHPLSVVNRFSRILRMRRQHESTRAENSTTPRPATPKDGPHWLSE